MRSVLLMVTLPLILIIAGCQSDSESTSAPTTTGALYSGSNTIISLPQPRQDSEVSIEQSLVKRRSIRSYSGEPLNLAEISQLLWAAQGITDPRGYRTAPSAGALYPLEVYLLAGDVEGLEAGIYRYLPEKHELNLMVGSDYRDELSDAALKQKSVADGAVSIVFTAIYERTTVKYGERGVQYVHIELGHATQNLCLQAAAMDLGAVTIGAFTDERVAEILALPDEEKPLYIIPVGRK